MTNAKTNGCHPPFLSGRQGRRYAAQRRLQRAPKGCGTCGYWACCGFTYGGGERGAKGHSGCCQARGDGAMGSVTRRHSDAAFRAGTIQTSAGAPRSSSTGTCSRAGVRTRQTSSSH